MSNPRAIAQVTEAASGTTGAGVTLSTDEPSLFAVGSVVELYPSQVRDGSPLTRAKQTVRYLVSTNPGTGQLTGTMNTDGYATVQLVQKGWIIDGTANDISLSGDTVRVVATGYAEIVAAIAAAVTLKARWVEIDGGDIVITTAMSRVNNVGIRTAPSSNLLLPTGAVNARVFNNPETVSSGAALTGAAARNSNTVNIGGANVTALGLAEGDIVKVKHPTLTPNRLQYNRVRSADAGTGLVTFWKPNSHDWTAADNLYKVTPLINSPLEVSIKANGNTGDSRGVFVGGHAFCNYKNCTFEGFNSGALQSALQTNGGFGNLFRDLYGRRIGTAGYGGMEFNAEWHYEAHNLKAEAQDFGIMFNNGGQGNQYDLVSDGAANRCIKYQDVRDTEVWGAVGSNCPAGPAIMVGTSTYQYNLNFHGPRAYNCAVAMQTNGNGAQFIRFIDPVVEDCPVGIWAADGDFDVEILNCAAVAAVYGGLGVLFDCSGRVTNHVMRDQTIGAVVGLAFTWIVSTTNRRHTVKVHAMADRVAGGAAGDGGSWELIATFSQGAQRGATALPFAVVNGAAPPVAPTLAFAGQPYLQANGAAAMTYNWAFRLDAETVY